MVRVADEDLLTLFVHEEKFETLVKALWGHLEPGSASQQKKQMGSLLLDLRNDADNKDFRLQRVSVWTKNLVSRQRTCSVSIHTQPCSTLKAAYWSLVVSCFDSFGN